MELWSDRLLHVIPELLQSFSVVSLLFILYGLHDHFQARVLYLVLGTMGYGVWKADIQSATTINKVPHAFFTYVPDHPTPQDIVQFQDASDDLDGVITAWVWSFGDGIIATDQNPAHMYSEAGTYTVTLTIMDDRGSTNVVTHEVVLDLAQPGLDAIHLIVISAGVALLAALAVIFRKTKHSELHAM